MSRDHSETDDLTGIQRRSIVDTLQMPRHLKPLLRLIAFRQHRHRYCWPSIATLSRDLDKSRATIYRQLAQLRDAGFIEWWKTGDNHRFSCSFQQVVNKLSTGETVTHDETKVSHGENRTSYRNKERNVLNETRIGDELFWSNLTAVKLRQIVRTKDLQAMRKLLDEGRQAFNWKVGDTLEVSIVALFKAAESRTEVQNPVGWVISVLKTLKPAQSPAGVRPAEERWARDVLTSANRLMTAEQQELLQFGKSTTGQSLSKEQQLQALARLHTSTR